MKAFSYKTNSKHFSHVMVNFPREAKFPKYLGLRDSEISVLMA